MGLGCGVLRWIQVRTCWPWAFVYLHAFEGRLKWLICARGHIVLPDCDKYSDTRLRLSEANWAKFTILLSSSSVSGIKWNSYTFTKRLSSHVKKSCWSITKWSKRRGNWKQRVHGQSSLNCLCRVKDRKRENLPTAEGSFSGNRPVARPKQIFWSGRKQRLKWMQEWPSPEDAGCVPQRQDAERVLGVEQTIQRLKDTGGVWEEQFEHLILRKASSVSFPRVVLSVRPRTAHVPGKHAPSGLLPQYPLFLRVSLGLPGWKNLL